jgi:2-polyprenyl-6-methoxyphenol hydroxylase-like FAD-dependent oxidoreductase
VQVRVLIQGAGIGGLTAATALAQRGIETDVAELRLAGAMLGVGLNQPANALAGLREVGVLKECLAAGWQFDDLHLWDPAGNLLGVIPPPSPPPGLPANNVIGRPALAAILTEAALAAGAAIYYGTTITDLTEDPGGATATFGTRHERYDLVVGFDGIRSPMRQRIFGDSTYPPAYTGSAVWRARTQRHPAVDRIVLSMAKDTKAVLTPVSADSMYIAVVAPEPGNPRQDPAAFAAAVRSRLAAFTGPIAEIRDTITDSGTVVYTPIEQVTVTGPWYRGQLAIAGDAAHASTPHLAQGGAMAVEDAVVLAHCLTRCLDGTVDLATALGTWYDRRRARAMFVQDMSRALLKEETGEPLTPKDQDLIAQGIPGAQQRLAEPY